MPAPEDPESRDQLRRKLVDDEAVRVLARKGRTLITENRLGLVQAAAGVDGSNVGRDELALLPVDPDASAAGLRAELRERLGVTVAVVITDTMGRAWRNGQTDAAVGAAGLAVLHNYSGRRRPARQRAAGHRDRDRRRDRRGRRPGQGQIDRAAGGRGARPAASTDDGSTARQLLRPGHRRPVLARHRRGPGDGSAAGPAAAQVGAPVQRRAGATGTGRSRRRGGPHRSGPTSHAAGTVRLAARARPPGPGCWTA